MNPRLAGAASGTKKFVEILEKIREQGRAYRSIESGEGTQKPRSGRANWEPGELLR